MANINVKCPKCGERAVVSERWDGWETENGKSTNITHSITCFSHGVWNKIRPGVAWWDVTEFEANSLERI